MPDISRVIERASPDIVGIQVRISLANYLILSSKSIPFCTSTYSFFYIILPNNNNKESDSLQAMTQNIDTVEYLARTLNMDQIYGLPLHYFLHGVSILSRYSLTQIVDDQLLPSTRKQTSLRDFVEVEVYIYLSFPPNVCRE